MLCALERNPTPKAQHRHISDARPFSESCADVLGISCADVCPGVWPIAGQPSVAHGYWLQVLNLHEITTLPGLCRRREPNRLLVYCYKFSALLIRTGTTVLVWIRSQKLWVLQYSYFSTNTFRLPMRWSIIGWNVMELLMRSKILVHNVLLYRYLALSVYTISFIVILYILYSSFMKFCLWYVVVL